MMNQHISSKVFNRYRHDLSSYGVMTFLNCSMTERFRLHPFSKYIYKNPFVTRDLTLGNFESLTLYIVYTYTQ